MRRLAHQASMLTLALLALTSMPTGAQQLYRIVGPDGKVTFSDRPPADQPAETLRAGTASPSADAATALPAELRSVAGKYPVTLYTGTDCAPCVGARNFLVQRGIPFTERTVTTAQDAEALKRLGGGDSLPFGTIGAQNMTGFAEQEWAQYLDAAGYPKQSRLPANYKRPAATPLTAPKAASAAAGKASAASSGDTEEAPARRRVVPAPSGTPTPQNPAGIRF